MEHAWSLVGAARMRALDRYTIDTLGVPGDVLMESAGRAVLEVVLARCGAALADGYAEALVVCGGGNNGGDGLVVARHLAQLALPVRVALLTAPEKLRGEARANFDRARATGVRIEGPDAALPERGVVVDAIFGTGLSRDVSGEAAAFIERLVTARVAGRLDVVAIDLPSGIDADTGEVLGCAVAADCTVTIACPKIGLALEPGRSLAGEVLVARIGIADRLPDEIEAEGHEAVSLWTRGKVAAQLPARRRGGHKGSFGHVLVVAGGEGKTGAAALAATAAVRAGAGLVTIACPRGLNDILEVKCTEAMTAPVDDTPERGFAESAIGALVALAETRDVVAFGPGIGQSADARAVAHALAAKVGVPMVVDADGLNAFAADVGALAARPAATVLTPHPGEAARLLGSSASEVNRDRVGAARELAARSGAVVVLKGAATVCAEPSGRAVISPTGGPNLATGGTGDVLTGVVAALLAQGLAPFPAAATAVWWHGRAGDRLARTGGDAGLMAHELADALPATAVAIREGESGERIDRGGRPGTLLPFPDA
jgi:NAD(P)H-hydrate epimerase